MGKLGLIISRHVNFAIDSNDWLELFFGDGWIDTPYGLALAVAAFDLQVKLVCSWTGIIGHHDDLAIADVK